MSAEEDPIPPIPQAATFLKEVGSFEKSKWRALKLENVWMQWLDGVRTKVNVIDANLVGLSALTGVGIPFKGPTGWRIGSINGTVGRISIIDGDGDPGNPTIDFDSAGVRAVVQAMLVAGTNITLVPGVGTLTINSTGGGGGTWNPITVTIPSPKDQHRQTIVDAAVTLTSVIELMLAPVPDTDENSPDMMDLILMHAIPGTGTFDVLITFSVATSGPIKLLYRRS
jgi:hypothetical protein